MVLKELNLTDFFNELISIVCMLGECGGLERSDF